MSTQMSRHLNSSLPHNLKLIGIIGGIGASCLILALVVVYLSEPPDLSQLINHLSEVRVTPSWPQIGVFPCVVNP
jgi:hypothetical protein